MVQHGEDVGLDANAREALLRDGPECTFIWSTREGWPVGVTMAYLWERERFWLVTGAARPRVAAVRRDPRVSIVVSGAARTLTAKGRCSLREDDASRGWVYAAFAARQARLFPDLIDAQRFGSRLARMQRMILEVTPERWIGYDARRAGYSVQV
jgi:hypothetical protein